MNPEKPLQYGFQCENEMYVYTTEVLNGSFILTIRFNNQGDIDRYVNLLMGEIPRLSDNASGYGPKGKDFIAHIDISMEVKHSFEELKKYFGNDTREANPLYASKP